MSEVGQREVLEAMTTPSGYAMLRLGLEPYPWQVSAMDGLDARHTRVALRTCNESGKTSLVIAGLVLWHMQTFAGSLTVTTSGAYRQIVGQLYPNLRAYTGKEPDRWQIKKDSGLYLPTGSRLVSFSTDNPGLAEGWHEPPRIESLFEDGDNPLADLGVTDSEWESVCAEKTSLMIVIDEAKSVDQGIFDAFERCHPTRYLVASSPGASSGPFYDCFHSQKARYRCVHARAADYPHLWEDPVRRREIDEQIATLPLPLVQSMIYGDFADTGEYQVFDMAAVSLAMSGTVPRWGAGTRRAALDLSSGGDETCLYMRDGNEAWLAGVWHERDDRKLVSEIIVALQGAQIRPEWVFADNGGLGLVILNEFERRGWGLNRINFGDPAREDRFYANRRAEMYFGLAHRVKRREIRLPADDVLRDQLGWQKYVPGDGPLRLIPKAQLPGSPDRADTVAMLFDDMPAAQEHADRQEQLARAASKTMLGPSDVDGYEWDTDSATGLWG